MKSTAPTLHLPVSSVAQDRVETTRDWVGCASEGRRDASGARATQPVASIKRVVRLMAFGQAVAFLAFWLWLCASVGAAPAKPVGFNPQLQLSTYEPTKTRDPIARVGASGAAAATTAPASFVLQGILFQASNPSAVVNGQLLTLNKPANVPVGANDVLVRAVEIVRDKVVLEVGGQTLELRLSAEQTPASP